MSFLKYIFLPVICYFIILEACQPDDICGYDIPDTPHVIITFYDSLYIHKDSVITDTTPKKRVSNFFLKALSVKNGIFYSGTDSILVPLNPEDKTSKFLFVKNAQVQGDSIIKGGDIDTLTFSYTRKDAYISRACGYKATFILNEENPIIFNDSVKWIYQIDKLTDTITNDTQTTLIMYH